MLLRLTCRETDRLLRTFCRFTLTRVGMLGPLPPPPPEPVVEPPEVPPLVEVEGGGVEFTPLSALSVLQPARPASAAATMTSFHERIAVSCDYCRGDYWPPLVDVAVLVLVPVAAAPDVPMVVPLVVWLPPPTEPLAASCCCTAWSSSGEVLFAVQLGLPPPPIER